MTSRNNWFSWRHNVGPLISHVSYIRYSISNTKYNNTKRSIPMNPKFVNNAHRNLHLWPPKSIELILLPFLVRKLWPRLKFLKLVKRQGQCHKVKNFGIHGQVLSQGMYICNMKAPPLLVKKLWPRLKFFKSSSNVKVTRSTILVPIERSCHKEYSYVIWKPYLFWLGSYGQG